MTGRDRVSPTALFEFRRPDKACAGGGELGGEYGAERGEFKGRKRPPCSQIARFGVFRKGGNQLQINILDREKLTAAVDDDELAKSIIVRVGGFSERFSNLSREFRRNIAERTQY